MILEIATFDIKEGHQRAFEEALNDAKNVIIQSKGLIDIKFHHCIEISTKYNVLIHWETLEAHTIGFRQSTLFTEWRAILNPYFQNPPVAEHFEFL